MAGTTGLETAASAVRVSGKRILSTNTFNDIEEQDGIVSHWKYITGEAIVYRASRDLEDSALRWNQFLKFLGGYTFSLDSHVT
jgi:hypothetical protein